MIEVVHWNWNQNHNIRRTEHSNSRSSNQWSSNINTSNQTRELSIQIKFQLKPNSKNGRNHSNKQQDLVSPSSLKHQSKEIHFKKTNKKSYQSARKYRNQSNDHQQLIKLHIIIINFKQKWKIKTNSKIKTQKAKKQSTIIEVKTKILKI